MRTMITGGSGLLAMNWACFCRDIHEVILITHNHPVHMRGVNSGFVDLTDMEAIRRAIESYSPDLIVHAAGLTDVDLCERDPRLAMDVNATLSGNVAKVANDYNIKFVHISTDQLFKGRVAYQDETAKVDPINVYGKSKALAEVEVLSNHSSALVVRTNFFGWGHRNRHSITDWIIQSVSRGEQIRAFDDVYFTPVYVDDLIASIYQLVDNGASGVVNISARDRVSKYEFSMMIADEFGLDVQCVKKSSVSEVSLLASRPSDMSLSNGKAEALLGRSLGTVLDGVQHLHATEGRSSEFDFALGT